MCNNTQVGAVVVGFDRYLNYYKIQYATLCIRENPGCLFIATNRDAVTHLTDAQVRAACLRLCVCVCVCVWCVCVCVSLAAG
jgi:ribonucleotide monophosphatase NagD (HAD superfamily)